MTKLKICGTTNLEDALFCDALRVDYLGFIFHEQSPRYIDPVGAKFIIERLKRSKAIGVFVNEPLDKILKTAKYLGLWGIQIYEDLDIPAASDLKVIRALRVKDKTDIAVAEMLLDKHPHDFVLLDTYNRDKPGGTGETFDWKLLPKDLSRIFLAGGIHAGNVLDAALKGPYAVDMVTGVEASKGKKDFEKIRQIKGLL